MAKRLYVGNLSYNVTADALRDLFAGIGEVASVTIITDRTTNLSKGFGFVEMAADDSANEAIGQLNGQEFSGRRLTVAEARPRQDAGFGARSGGGERSQRY